ncbi:MAG: alpha-hydroxy-acid oxidizing protein [Actinomycetota bacterium]|nr:alpha-hydroxy-acid oxidizing protein [Actinomycetota bacterium]
MELEQIYGTEEFESIAKERMDPGAFAYYAGGAGLELTLRENVAAFRRYRFRPRVLRGHIVAQTSTTLLGTQVALPIALAPAALQRLAHPDGEVAVARAAGDAGILMCLATESSCSLEDVAAAADGPKWFQCYVHRDRGLTEEILRRAEATGYSAIVLTVDLPVPGYREREYRHAYVVPPHAVPGNFAAATDKPIAERVTEQYSRGLRWDDIAWLRDTVKLPIVLKGILSSDDAELAVEHGADAIFVSNHGARQLDQSVAPIDVLEEVTEAIQGRAEVYLDGGVRRGTDVLIALALGARAVFIGRPYLWGLAAGGQEGVARVLAVLRLQLENGMVQLGAGTLEDITREHVF